MNTVIAFPGHADAIAFPGHALICLRSGWHARSLAPARSHP